MTRCCAPRCFPRCPARGAKSCSAVDEAGASRLAERGKDVRVYVPYGPDWFRYFMRRRAESQGA
jgi:proline dehydrogenase